MSALADQYCLFYERNPLMAEIRQYIITVTAAAIFCAIITGLLSKNSSGFKIVKLLSGLFLAYTVIAPWTKINLKNITLYTDEISSAAERFVQSGADYVYSESAVIIKEKSEAYILDKAASMGVDIEVEVFLSRDNPPVPESAVIKGAVSPYAKERLKVCFQGDLGIPKENLLWI